MKKVNTLKVFLIIGIIFSNSIISQNKGELITPNIPFPKNISGKLKGNIHIDYHVDKNGMIKSFALSDITIDTKRKENRYVTIYDKDSNKNSKLGISIASRLKPWINKYGNKTNFKKIDWNPSTWIKVNNYGIWSAVVDFGYSSEEKKERESGIKEYYEKNKDLLTK